MINTKITKETFNVFECSEISDSLKDFWKSQGLTNDSFFCKDCGHLMLNLKDLKGVHYKHHRNGDHIFSKEGVKNAYVESLQNRSLVKGRFFSGKFFTRVLCWDCFHRQMTDYIKNNIDHIKYNWYRKYLKDEIKDYYPKAWQSATFYFKFLFDMTDEELHTECRKFVTADLEFFIKKYGKKEGPLKFEEYRKWQSYAGCSKEYFIEKYGEEEGTRKFEEVNRSKSITKKNCIEKYGKEKGLEVFNHYCKRQAYCGNKLEYFIEKYGEEEGKKKYQEICSHKAITLENMIRVHGEKEGPEKYQKFLQSFSQSSSNYSSISQELFRQIDNSLGYFAIDSKWAEKNGEYSIFIDTFHCIRPDYLLGNKIIEFNGDFWHMNPSMHLSGDFNTVQQLQAHEIWKQDNLRMVSFQNLGYKVKVVWENDYRENPQKVISECCKFLSDGKCLHDNFPKQDNMDVVLSL